MSGNGTMRNFKKMLGEAKLPEKTVMICLRGDLAADHEEAERELERVERDPSDSLAGNGAAELAERITALEAEMQESTWEFRLRALSRPAWRALMAEHQPRKGEDGGVIAEDAVMGLNMETFFDAIIRACLVDPELTDEEWGQLNDALTDHQFDTLFSAAWALNRRDVDVPFSHAASRMRKGSADG